MEKTLTKKWGWLVGQTDRPTYINVDAGLLVMRLGLGGMLMYFGIPKITGGPEMWRGVGGALSNFGINFAPGFWGLCAGLSEAVGGLFLALGLFFRPAAASILFTMIVAATMMLKTKGLFDAAHAIDLGIVALGLLVTGPGVFSLDRKIFK